MWLCVGVWVCVWVCVAPRRHAIGSGYVFTYLCQHSSQLEAGGKVKGSDLHIHVLPLSKRGALYVPSGCLFLEHGFSHYCRQRKQAVMTILVMVMAILVTNLFSTVLVGLQIQA